MRRKELSECEIGDWVGLMEGKNDWDTAGGPYKWSASKRGTWHFAYTEVLTIDPIEGMVGTDFVWMRYDPAGEIPLPPWGIKIREEDPADWWKRGATRQAD